MAGEDGVGKSSEAGSQPLRSPVAGTFEWLDKSYDLRDPDCLVNVRGDPLLSFLRGDPRYKAFLKRMNLPE